MLKILEDIQLTDTTTSYRINIDTVDLEETLDQIYERHRAAAKRESKQALYEELINHATGELPTQTVGE